MDLQTKNQIKSKVMEVTRRVKVLIYDFDTLKDLSDAIGIAKGTLYNRIKNHTWTYEEKLIIDELYKKTK